MTDPLLDDMDDTEHGNHLFDLFAKVGVSIDTLSAKLQRQNDLEQLRLASLPNPVSLAHLSTPGAATTDTKDFGGPQPGREWHVRLLSAIATPLGANASVVTWYVGQVFPGGLPPTYARWQFPSVPAFQSFTSDVIVVRAGERLIAVLSGVPAQSTIALGVGINEQPMYGGRALVQTT